MNELLFAFVVFLSCCWLGLLVLVSHFYWRGRRSIERSIERAEQQQLVELRHIRILLTQLEPKHDTSQATDPESGAPD